MSENLGQWPFVIAAYVVGVGGTLAMAAWSWFAMRRAEARRDRARDEA